MRYKGVCLDFHSSWGLLLGVEVGLRLLRFPTLVALLEKGGLPARPTSRAQPMSPPRAAYLVEIAARYSLARPTCLKKSLVLYALLRKAGIAAKLVIGTTAPQSGFRAHAWVEAAGRIFGGEGAGKYAPLASFAASGTEQQIA